MTLIRPKSCKVCIEPGVGGRERMNQLSDGPYSLEYLFSRNDMILCFRTNAFVAALRLYGETWKRFIKLVYVTGMQR